MEITIPNATTTPFRTVQPKTVSMDFALQRDVKASITFTIIHANIMITIIAEIMTRNALPVHIAMPILENVYVNPTTIRQAVDVSPTQTSIAER